MASVHAVSSLWQTRIHEGLMKRKTEEKAFCEDAENHIITTVRMMLSPDLTRR